MNRSEMQSATNRAASSDRAYEAESARNLRSDRADIVEQKRVKNQSRGKSNCCTCNWIRSIVSTNKVRLQEGGYNLDLTYITNRIIACGFPAAGFESMYRNRKSDIVQFLKEHHGDMVKIYNLCIETRYSYSPETVAPFSTSKFPFLDHNVTNLQKVFTFCLDAALFLQRMEQYHKKCI